MRIVEPAVERVGIEIAQVFLIEFAQGADEPLRIGNGLGRKLISLKFEPAGQIMGEGREPEGDGAYEQGEYEQGGCGVGGRESKGLIKLGSLEELIQSPKHCEKSGGAAGEEFGDMFEFVMADFVSQDGLDFGFAQLLD